MPDSPSCTKFHLSLLIVPKGDKQQISFGITKGCDDKNKPTWAITFLLEEKDGDKWKTRVDFKLDINLDAPTKTDKAEKIADTGHLSQPQANWITGPMYVAAVRESQQQPPSNQMLDAIALDAEETERSKEFTATSNKDLDALLADFAVRRRPGLKEVSLMFLDID